MRHSDSSKNTPLAFGAKGDGVTDDTAALQRWADNGGGDIPPGNFTFAGPIKFGDGFTIAKWEGNLLFRRGWPSGYALCSKDWTRPTRGVRIDASAGGQIIYAGDSDLSRKGLGLTYLQGFEVINATVVGGAAGKGINLFSCELRGCRQGTLRGGRFAIHSGQEGADGIHFSDNNSDISIVNATTQSGDDSVGLTVEVPKFAGSVMERIKLISCTLGNEGHSSLKVLLTTISRKAVIRDLELRDCTMRTLIAKQGTGVPVVAINRARATGSVVDGLTISGGSTTVVPSEGRYLGSQAMQFQGIDRLHLIGHAINFWSPVAISAIDCPGMIVERCPMRPVGTIARSWRPAPVLRIDSSPGAQIDVSGVQPGWAGQTLIEGVTPR